MGDTEKALLIAVQVAVALVLVTPLIVNAPPLPHSFFPFIVGKAIYSRTLIEIAFGLWVVLAIRSPEYRIPRSWLVAALAIYLVVALLASVLGVSPQRSLWSTYERMQGWVDLAHWLAFILVVGSVFKTWSLWRSLLNFNLVVAFVMQVLGVGEMVGVSLLSFIDPEGKLHITLGNSTYVGAYHLVNVLIALGFLAHSYSSRSAEEAQSTGRRRRRRGRKRADDAEEADLPTVVIMRVFWALVAVLGVVMVLQSGTRGALIGLGAGFLAFAIGYVLWGGDRTLRRASLGVVVLLLGFAVLIGVTRNTAAFESVASNVKALDRLSHISLTEGSFSHRLNSAQVGLEGWAQKPLFGWGPENFTIAYDRNVTGDILAKQTQSFDQAHNKLVEELTTKGALGFLSYMSIWLAMLWIFRRRVRSQDRQQQIFTLSIGAALVGYFVQNLALFDTPGTVGQFMLLVGFALYLDTTSDEDAAVRPELRTDPSSRLTPQPSIFRWAFQRDPSASERPPQKDVESPLVFPLQLATAGVLVAAAIFVINVRAYQASRTILDTLNPNTSWDARLDYFDETIETFPQLANYPRLVMFNQLTRDWTKLEDEEKQRAVQLAEEQGVLAFEQEPEEWRLYGTLAGFYQRIGPPFSEKSRELVDKVAELAPERLETIRLQVGQAVVDGDHETAYRVIDEYVDRYPEAGVHFESLRERVDRSAEAAPGG